jgi:fucose permease
VSGADAATRPPATADGSAAGGGGSAQRAARSLAALGLGGFVVLGLPDGMLGTAWPSMRATFHQPLGSLGLIMVLATAGNLATSLSVGRLLHRFGVGRLLIAAGLVAALGATVFAAAPHWWMVLVGAFLFGAAAGLLDTGLNTVVALSGRLRLLNMLHGAYGVGSALGPVVVTAAVLWTSWRPAYVLVIGLELLLAFGWWQTRSRWPADPPPEPANEAVGGVGVDVGGPASDGEAEPVHLRLLIALGITMFFLYTGLESMAGQWAASFFRGSLGMSAGAAGAAVFVYWGSLTVARFGVAIPRRTPNPEILVRVGCAGALVASALIWWAPSVTVVVVAFAVMGAALAPVFPALVSLTPVRIGRAKAQHAIGWQIASANVGAAGLSATTGVVLQHLGLTALGPCLVVVGVAMLACNFGLEVFSKR